MDQSLIYGAFSSGLHFLCLHRHLSIYLVLLNSFFFSKQNSWGHRIPSRGKFRYRNPNAANKRCPLEPKFALPFTRPRLLFLPQLQINYDRNLGNLIVHVLQARNLAQRDNDSYSDPFVKVYLLPGRGWDSESVCALKNVRSASPFLLLCPCLVFSPLFLSDRVPTALCVWNWLTNRAGTREWEWIRWHEAVNRA